MPRITKNPVVFLALSPAGVATALGIPTRRVADAIAERKLVVRCLGTKRRILVSDVEAWVRTWPEPAPRKRRNAPDAR